MIVFDLRCAQGHVFEAWFRSSQVYEDQRASGEISCPECGNIYISKAIMAPNISAGKNSDRLEKRLSAQEQSQDRASSPALASLSLPEEYKKVLEGVRQMVRANCEDVGSRFAEEAKKIHYGEAEERGIYGQATPEESESLREEGIEFMHLPLPIRTDS